MYVTNVGVGVGVGSGVGVGVDVGDGTNTQEITSIITPVIISVVKAKTSLFSLNNVE